MLEFKAITSVIEDDGVLEDYSNCPLLAVKLTPYIDPTKTNVLFGKVDENGVFTVTPTEEATWIVGVGDYGHIWFYLLREKLTLDVDSRVIRCMDSHGKICFGLGRNISTMVMIWSDNSGWENFSVIE